MIFGAILAGGTGSRMNIADMPKQFLPLGEKPIVVHTLEKFLLCDQFDAVYLGVHPSWVTHMQDLIDQYIKAEKKIVVVPGGRDRNQTIMRVIEGIEADYGESDEHIIVTHDAVRPFITMRILEENIAGAKEFGAVDTVTAAVDTIVRSEDGKVISEIPERRRMYQGQTPQSFRMSMIKRLYLSLSEEEKGILTDACKICVVRDQPVHLVEGEISNIKITTISDYKIAQAMLGGIDG